MRFLFGDGPIFEIRSSAETVRPKCSLENIALIQWVAAHTSRYIRAIDPSVQTLGFQSIFKRRKLQLLAEGPRSGRPESFRTSGPYELRKSNRIWQLARIPLGLQHPSD
jgi:hypothetical protein